MQGDSYELQRTVTIRYISKNINIFQNIFFYNQISLVLYFRSYNMPFDSMWWYIVTFLGLKPLTSRRLDFDFMFLFQLLNGHIGCPEFLAKINLKMRSLYPLLYHISLYSNITKLFKIARFVTYYDLGRNITFFVFFLSYILYIYVNWNQ